MYFERIIDAQTGEEIVREYTAEEVKQMEEAKKIEEVLILEKKAKDDVKTSAINKLLDLGLTEEEAKAFLG